jgi:hypothetical protein
MSIYCAVGLDGLGAADQCLPAFTRDPAIHTGVPAGRGNPSGSQLIVRPGHVGGIIREADPVAATYGGGAAIVPPSSATWSGAGKSPRRPIRRGHALAHDESMTITSRTETVRVTDLESAEIRRADVSVPGERDGWARNRT